MSNYSKKQIFENSRVNALLDRIYFEIVNALPDIKAEENLCLTGKAAALLQDAIYEDTECENIILLTGSIELHNFIERKLPRLIEHEGVVRLQNRTLYYFPGLYLEVWYQEEDIYMTRVNEINVQELKSINPAFL